MFPKIVKINDSNELELDMDMEVLSRHASNVMHSLGAAVESLDQSEFFNGIVENIGRSHGQRKIKPKMLEVQLCQYVYVTHCAVWVFDTYEGWTNWGTFDVEIGFGFLKSHFSHENFIYY